MRQNLLALMLLVVIMIGTNSDGAAGAAAKCRKPNGKLGQTKANGCATKVCKGSGGGGAAWESCPLPASGEAVQEEMKSLRTLLNENQKETKKNHELLMEVLKQIGLLPQTTVPLSSVVFELKQEFNPAKGFLMGTLPYLGKKFNIRFEWFITGVESGYQNIIHFTIGGDNSAFGDRTPGVWIDNDREDILAVSAIQPKDYIRTPFAAKTKTGIWMEMEISQYMVADNKFEFGIKIDGKSFGTLPNSRPTSFSDVKMYAGDPWHTALIGKIRNFQVELF